MKLIPLSKNGKKHKGKYFAMVDDYWFGYLNQWNWYAAIEKNTVYAKRDAYKGTVDGKYIYETILMHRLILGLTDPDLEGDHIDLNGINNQEQNLRGSTHGQNAANTLKKENTTSKYRGVSTITGKKDRWGAYIKFKQKTINLGYFFNEEEAARAYDRKAKELHGEFATLNFKEAQ